MITKVTQVITNPTMIVPRPPGRKERNPAKPEITAPIFAGNEITKLIVSLIQDTNIMIRLITRPTSLE